MNLIQLKTRKRNKFKPEELTRKMIWNWKKKESFLWSVWCKDRTEMAEKVETNKMNPSLEQRTESLFTKSMKSSSQKKKLERIKAKALSIKQQVSKVREIHSNNGDLKWAGIIDAYTQAYHPSCCFCEPVKMGRTKS